MTHASTVRDLEPEEDEELLDFSTPVWQGARLDAIRDYLIEHIDLISKSPIGSNARVARLLSHRLEIGEDQLLLTDGGYGALRLIAGAHRGSRSLLLPPVGREYREALRHAGHEVVEAPTEAKLSELETEGIDFVWLSVPTNPDGRVFSYRELLAFVRSHPDTRIVVDLSMRKYLLEETLKPSDIEKYPNLVLLSSFARAYNLSGLCVGYICASADFLARLREDYAPLGISSIALEAVRFVLLHPATFTIPIRKWLRDARLLTREIDKIDGLKSELRDAPYFIVKCSSPAERVADYLLKEHHILVGSAATGLELHGDEIRITPMPHQADNDALVNALHAWAETSDRATL